MCFVLFNSCFIAGIKPLFSASHKHTLRSPHQPMGLLDVYCFHGDLKSFSHSGRRAGLLSGRDDDKVACRHLYGVDRKQTNVWLMDGTVSFNGTFLPSV